MDKNKLKVLQGIEYKILRTCGLCEYGDFAPKGPGQVVSDRSFGQCKKHKYNHRKHTSNPRSLSIHRGGTCYDWEKKQHMGAWEEFVDASE